MGNYFSNNERDKVMLLGLDNAGKTTILNYFKNNPEKNPIPTIGFNVALTSKRFTNAAIWDVGGQEAARKLWMNYVKNCTMLVYVIDLSDKDRFKFAFTELLKILNGFDGSLRNTPIIIVGNKTDLVAKDNSIKSLFIQECIAIAHRFWEVKFTKDEKKNVFIHTQISAHNINDLKLLNEMIIFELEEINSSYLWKQFRLQFLTDEEFRTIEK